jgi:amidohydrolase
MDNMEKTTVHSHADDLQDQMIRWRHDLHRHPELGFAEHRTAARVSELLRDFGLDVHEGVGGTGVVGVLKRGNGSKSIGLRADMDALAIDEENSFSHQSKNAGRMHACGHDGHTAMLLGAAKNLAEDADYHGTAVFIFQPAEEHGRGALAMIEDGLFDRFPVDAVYGMHNMPSLATGHFAICPGPIMACEDNFEIVIHGKGGHAALPHLTIDPITIGAEIVTALQFIVSRTVDPVASGVLSITDFSVAATRNVIPAKIELRGDTRSLTAGLQQHIETTMERIVAGICAARGATYEFKYTHEFAVTVNSATEAGIAARIAQDCVGADKVDAACKPIMASEDFGFMLQQKAGCYVLLGNGGEGAGGCGLHSTHYDFNDRILSTGARFWTLLVRSQLAA